MSRIGETLREAREARNLSLREVEAATKIRLKYLEALENEDYSELPGRVYIVGFLKSYAKFLELEDYALVEEYKAANKNEEAMQSLPVKPTAPKDEEGQRTSKWLKVGGVALIVFLLVTINVIYQQQRDKSQLQNTQLPPAINGQTEEDSTMQTKDDFEPEDEQVFAPDSTPANSEEDTEFSGVQVQVKVLPNASRGCWINVISDGKQHFSGTLKAGESMEFAGEKEVKIKFGDAGAVQVSFNGEDQGTIGENGSVKTLEFKSEQL